MVSPAGCLFVRYTLHLSSILLLDLSRIVIEFIYSGMTFNILWGEPLVIVIDFAIQDTNLKNLNDSQFALVRSRDHLDRKSVV